MVWGMLSRPTLGTLIPMDGRLDSRAYLSIVARPFMAAVSPITEGDCHQDNTPGHKGRIDMD